MSPQLVLVVLTAARETDLLSTTTDAAAGGSGGAGINLGAQACDPQATGCHQIKSGPSRAALVLPVDG